MTKANETFVENVESNIGQKNIDHLVKQYPLLAGYNPVPPLPSQRAHQPPENKVVIYEHAFKHEMRMKKVLTAEEIAGISFRKQDVDKQLEQAAASEHVEETPAESGNKRKAAGTSEAQKKKKMTPKQLEDMRNDNFVAIEPRSADLPPPINEHVEETQPTTPRVNPELEATATSKDKAIPVESESTLPPPQGSFRVANLRQLCQSSAENAAEQSAFLQQIFPAEFREQLAALPFNQALNAFVQNGLVFFGMFADQARRSSSLYDVALRKEVELGLLQAGVDQVKKDRDAAEEARKAVELTAAETKTLLIQERKKNQELVGAVDQAKGETERVRLELEKVTRERDDAVTNRELAEADMTKLRTALPAIAQKVMDSEPVSDRFNAYVDAVKDHEVNKAVREVIQACGLTPPFPDIVQKKLKEGTAAALLEAEEAIKSIPIPLINAFAADPTMPLDGFLKEDY
ncbi:uncharacterized protein [Rutidosis leptorrhynchoides]|uniref:uncharacterized protein n=1 Tax=Rutidosis leptorrhynchoides TaxID=125765 RepID=UPI003A98DE32